MDNDDKQIGQVLNRRDVLKILGISGAAGLLTACAPAVAGTISPTSTTVSIPTEASVTEAVATELAVVSTSIPACVVRPELTEGPFFVDEMLNRSDVRSDPSDGSISQGAQLDIVFNVSQVNASGCTVLPGAQVDIWHCDAFGVYSDVQDSVGKKFLRGYQVTDANGQARFTTVYPGWYNGRAVHIHFKIRANNQEFTSQLFFDEALTDQVYAQPPYAQRGERTVRNEQDGIFNNSGSQLLLNVVPSGSGYTSTFDIGMQV